MKNRILFVVTGYYFNGGTTFLIRLLKKLSEQKIELGVLFLKKEGDEQLLEKITQVADVNYLLVTKNEKKLFPLSILYNKRINLKEWFQSYSHVHVMGFFSYLKAIDLLSSQTLSIGVYQQDEYISKKFDKTYVQKTLHKFVKLKNISFVFFNEDNVARYSRIFSLKSDSYVLTPIGVEDVTDCRSAPNNRIVSVGNFMSFKTYFANTIKAIAELKSIGLIYQYDIFGEGPNKRALKSLVDDLKVGDLVKFKGILPYTELYKTLASYKALVGSGTVVVEASMLGVPSIIGIENEKESLTYGLLTDFEGLSYNEKGLCYELFPLKDTIKKIMSLDINGDEYRNYQYFAKKRAKDFSIEVTANVFSELLKVERKISFHEFSNLKKWRVQLSLIWICILAIFSNVSFKNRKQQ